jgi:membrane associated rhomboid family serine protease
MANHVKSRTHRASSAGPAGNTRVTTRKVIRTARRQIVLLGGILTVMWIIFAINNLSGGALNQFGVLPRSSVGLRGLLLSPLIHERLDHVVANSIPFAALGWMVLLRDARHFVPVTGLAMLGSGLFAWMLGAPGSVHIGASGVLFGYLGFLILSGWYARGLLSIAISLLVIALWGGVVLGAMPGDAGVSWQSHLGGLLTGMVTARSYRTRG